MALRVRKLDLSLALCTFAVSFGITLTAALLVRHHDPAHPHRQAATPAPVQVQTGTTGELTPAALDRQWVTYSDKSTCADRAGGDGVSAVRLSSSQVAWFFSDSSLGPAGPDIGLSKQSGFVHNLVVMQTTTGLASRLVTVTGGDACAGPGGPGHARSVVSPGIAGGPADQRYWAGDGLRIGSRVLRFYTRYQPGALVPAGTVIASFAVRQLASDGQGPAFGAVIRPDITRLRSYTPPGGGTPIVWGAAMVRQGGTIYIYGWQSSGLGVLPLHYYMAKVAAARLTDLPAWRFYVSDGLWATGQRSAQPIAADAGLSVDTGFSVIKAAGRYWLIEQAGGPGSPDIDAYPGPAPWGPFETGAGILLYRASGIGLTAADGYQIMYEARAEPALSTKSTLLISFNVNSLAVTAGCVPLSAFTNAVIQPRFVAVPREDFAAPWTARPGAAVAGPPLYSPADSSRDPRWFDSWAYSGGCPPLTAVRDISVQHADNQVVVRWRSSGPGVRYQIYLRADGADYTLVRTASSPSVTFAKLAHGRRYQMLIVPENTRQRIGQAAAVAFSTP
jgi:hypothetical protein